MNSWKHLVVRRHRLAVGSVAALFGIALFAAGGLAATGSLGSFNLAGSSSDTTSTTDTTSTDTISTTDTTSTDTTPTTTDTTSTTTDTAPTTATASGRCSATGAEAVSTNKADYAPGETVQITGTGFGASCDVTLRITLPDTSTSLAGDTATTADGGLSYDYAIPSSVADGTLSVEVLGDGGAVLAGASFAVTSPPAAVSCSAIGSESVSTDKPSYTAGETVHISGAGFAPACDVVVRITLPGGSTATFNTTSGAGDFSVDYTTPGVPAPTGTFTVDALGLADSVLASTTFETVAGGVSTPSISSNKGDYDPGEWVTLSGAGWQPAEHVHIVVNDDIGQVWSYVADVTASASGTFATEFQLPNSFVAEYSVTATGDHAGTATTTFTDAQTSFAEGGGTWTGTCSSPTNAVSNDSNRAACEPSGEYVDGQGFGLDSLVPADATGMSFIVYVNGQVANTDSTDVWRVSLSWNGGTNFTSTTDSADVFTSSGSDADAFIPSQTTCSNFGHTWTYSELSNTNFRVRVAAIPDSGTGETMSIDDIDVRVCYGDYSINASVAGGTSAVASPSAAIPAAVEVQHTNASGTSNWNSTQYQVEGQSAVCVNHGPNSDSGSGTDTERFNITAPSAHGTYDVTFTPYEDAACSAGTFAPMTLTDAITVGIFGDSFGITGPDTVPGWTDGDGSGSDAAIRTRTGIIDPNGYVRLRGSGTVTSYQEGTGPWTGSCSSPSNAVTSNDSRSLCDSGENVVGSGFGLDSIVPTGASNISFKVRVEGRVSNTSDTDVFGVQLSWNGGTNYTGTTNTGEVSSSFSSSDDTNTAPNSEESCGTFGRTWSASELSDANFRVRVAAAPSTSSDDMDIDDIDVLVCFDGPNLVTKSGISTAGLGNIHLKYKWGQQADNDGDGAGDLQVQWKRSVDSTWTNVNTHNLVDNSTTNPTTAEDESLGASAGNTSIDIRFLGNTPESDDQARVDDVLVTGSASVASDAPTVDSPICAGATSVSGTSTEASSTSIEVFKNGSSVGTTTVNSGTWTKSSLAALVAGDQIKARATASGETASADSNVVTVVTCNTAPVAVDDTYSTNEDTSLILDDVAAGPNDSPVDNDTDDQLDTLTVTNVTGATHGTVGLASGTITFTPTANYCGTGANAGGFDYTVSDGSLADSGHVKVNITCVNDPPVAADDDASGTEDNDVSVTKASLLANDSDGGDGGALSLTAVSNPSGGTVEISGANVVFHPTANLCGNNAASFDYTVSDGTDTDTGTVTIDLTCINDPPVATDDDASGTEDNDVTKSKASLLGNDSDGGDGGALSLTAVSNPSGGTVEISGANVVFHPTGDLCGNNAASFDYTVSDGTDTDTGTVTIDLTCENDPPVAVDDTYTTNEDTNVTLDDAAAGSNDSPVDNDADVDLDTLKVTNVSNPTGGTVGLSSGTITFDPTDNLCGTAAGGFDYTVSDGNGGTDTGHVTVDITCVNDKPVLTVTPNSYTGQYSDPIDTSAASGLQPISISATDVDNTGSQLTFTIENSACSASQALPLDLAKTELTANSVTPGSRTAKIDGRFNVNPSGSPYTRCIRVSDGSASDTKTLTLTVNKENATVMNLDPTYVLLGSSVTESGTFVEENDGYPSIGLSTSATAYGATPIRLDLAPIGAGSTGKSCTDTDGPTNPAGGVQCSAAITSLLADVYEVDASSTSSWFNVGGIDTLAVYDPASGFATGGGHFQWNAPNPWGGGSKVNFGFTGKLVNKNVKGSVLTVIHSANGPYVMKTNAFTGLTNARVTGQTYWYTSMTGKATYSVPSGQNQYCSPGVQKCGGFTIIMYAEDRKEPGAGYDTYRLKLIAPNGSTVVFDMALATIAGGNVQVPH